MLGVNFCQKITLFSVTLLALTQSSLFGGDVGEARLVELEVYGAPELATAGLFA